MKTAEEARMAMKNFDATKLSGYSNVKKEINAAINENTCSVYLDGNIDSTLARYLRSIGYIVEFTNDRNDSITIIRWDELE